jgi:hypothetical protein
MAGRPPSLITTYRFLNWKDGMQKLPVSRVMPTGNSKARPWIVIHAISRTMTITVNLAQIVQPAIIPLVGIMLISIITAVTSH